jgi:hypothetical protein
MKLQPKIINQFFDTIIATIESLSKNKDRLTKRNEIDMVTFRKEYSTIKISLPRRTGNTLLAAKLLKKYADSIFITSKRIHWEHFCEKNPKEKIRSYSINMSDVDHWSGILIPERKLVVADNVSQFSEAQLEKLYRIKSDFFILIG